MRLHRLELQAFGPFAGREEVDFSALNEAGLFLLDGPTGAGKSTVLAGICFALYGTVPGDRSVESLASTQASLGSRPEVLLDLTVGGRRFEVRRWPRYRRPARRRSKDGSGLTEEKAGAVLREHRDGDWHEISVRADEIGQVLRGVLHLDADQFMRVVLLPQGEFATFLRAKSAEKESLLRKLFGTGRFDGVEDHLAAHHRSLESKVSRDRDQVDGARADLVACLADGLGEGWWASREPAAEAESEPAPADWPDDELSARGATAIGAAVEAAAAARRRAAADLDREQAALEELVRRQQDLRQAAAWERRTAAHHGLAAQVRLDREALDLHRSAGSVDRRARESEDAGGARRRSAERLEGALSAALADAHCRDWTEEEPAAEVRPRFDALRGRAVRELGRLSDRERDAGRLRTLDGQAQRLGAEADALDGQARAAGAELETLAAARQELGQRIEGLGASAAGAEAARRSVEEATARHRAARDHEEHRTALVTAEDAHRRATDRAQQTVDVWHEVVERRLAGAASLLAAELRADQPCQVCGSTEHPAPAAPGGTEISAAAQGEARRAMDQATAGRTEAAEDVRRAREAAEHSRLAAAGLAPADARQALDRVRNALRDAEDAARDLAAARSALEANERHEREHTATVETARQQAAVARTRREAAVAEADRLRTQLAEALGGRDSPQVLRTELESASAAIEAVLDAAEDASMRASLAEQADRALAAELERSAFDSVEQVRAALLDAADERLRAGRVQDWDREEAALAELGASEAVRRGRDLMADGHPAPADEDVEDQAQRVQAAAGAREEAAARAGGLESVQRQVLRQAGVLGEVAARSAGQLADLEEAEGLLKLVRGQGENALKMTLGSYVLAGRLEEVVASATERLLGMTQGRYELRHDDSARGRGVRGLDITVCDRYTEDERPAGTLSGGETFMASLALALGLADTVQAEAGGVDMDTLFVDEGFGSLDADSLADVMDVLDGLQAGGRAIGVVSHVERMKQDIGYRLQVTKTRQGSHLRVVVPEGV